MIVYESGVITSEDGVRIDENAVDENTGEPRVGGSNYDGWCLFFDGKE